MNEQLQASLGEILNSTVQGVKAGVVFLQGELPDIIRQLLVWKAAESAIFFILSTLALIFFATLAVKAWGFAWKTDDDDYIGVAFFFGVLPSVLFLFFTINNLEWLQIWLAPKLYLIEYAAKLVK